MERMVKEIMENKWIYPVFQPIVSLRDGRVIGYEALSRISDKAGRKYNHIPIEDIFHAAEKADYIWKFDYLCRKKAMKEYFGQNEFDQEELLFINVYPKIMEDKRFSAGFTQEYLKRFNTKPENIVFEITEYEAVSNKEDYQNLVLHYKRQGFDIAIDDVGSGYSGLERICYSNPNYIKLDMTLVREIHKNHIKEAMVKGMMDFAISSNIQVIAEGIETREELEKLIELGVQYGQGNYLGYPQRYLGQISDEVAQTIYVANQRRHKIQNYSAAKYYIKNITFPTLTVSSDEKIGNIQEHLENNPDMPGVCVCHHNKVKGVLTREKLAQMLGGRYGFSLYQNRAVSLIMNRDFLCVDEETPISAVSEIAMRRDKSQLYDFIVVSKNNEYFGVVTVKDLLVNATQLNLIAARDANPLTGLPGNLIIEREAEHRLQEKKDCSILYLDLDNFKAYNDRYGFECGDKVIRAVADSLHEVVGDDGFIGHVGGDDFVVILSSTEWEAYVERIGVDFRKRIQPLYSEEDWERGYIVAANRKGEVERFPVVSITVVAVTSQEKMFCSYIEVTKELAKRKKEEKKRRSEAARSICYAKKE